MTGSSLQALVAAAEIQSEGANANEENTTTAEAENGVIKTEVTPDEIQAQEVNVNPPQEVVEHHQAGDEEHPLQLNEVPPQEQHQQQVPVADPVALAVTADPAVTQPENGNVAAIQSTTANPIAPSDVPVMTENPIALDSGSQPANPIIGEDGNGGAVATGTTANPIVPEAAPENPVAAAAVQVVAPVMTVNPVVPEMTAVHETAAAATTSMTANPSTNLDFNMDESVPALPVLHVHGTTEATAAGVKVHHDDAAAVERAQQEAIAAAVVANNPPPALTPPDGTVMPQSNNDVAVQSIPQQQVVMPMVRRTLTLQSGDKPARKRGWVKKTWEERLEELKAYKAIHGDCNVPTICKANPSLGHWVHDQRKQYRLYQNNKQTSMNPLRIAQLEEVGFKWALQRHTTMRSWAERFAQLEDFKRANGHCNVPIRYKTNPSLGQWVSTQRQEYSNYRNGKKSNMTQERITKLEAADFCWSLRDTAKMAPRKSWDMHFAALKEYKKEHGHCDVRVRSKQQPTGSLGRWVEKQRSQYHSKNEGKESKLTQDQIDKLDSIGFKWRIRHERNKISGCARNPELKIDDEAMMDDYTRRAMDENTRSEEPQQNHHVVQQIEQVQVHVPQGHLQSMEQVTEQQVQHVIHDTQMQDQSMQQVVHEQQMQAQDPMHHHDQQMQHVHHMDGQSGQMDAQEMGVQIEPETMKVDNTMEGTVPVAIEPMSIETAAAVAAAEGIPVEGQAQPGTIPVHVPVPESVPAPVPVAMPIHESIDDAMAHEV